MNRRGLDDALVGTRKSLALQPRDPVHDRATEASASSPEVHPDRVQTQYRVRNWPEYDKALRARGDVTVWISEEACNGWTPSPMGNRGGQRIYSDIAIQTVLTLRLLFHLPLRATEAFVASIFKLAGLKLSVPDHTTLSRRGRRGVDPHLARDRWSHAGSDSGSGAS